MTRPSKRARRGEQSDSAGSTDADADTSVESRVSLAEDDGAVEPAIARTLPLEKPEFEDEEDTGAAESKESEASADADAMGSDDPEEGSDDPEEGSITDDELGSDGAMPGVIERIELIDFMNHRHQEINFVPAGVNFIHGCNGAGKSAFLHALQVCLGARANTTHRGNKLTDFIRQGSANGRAIVRVTLSNRGEEAYLPEVYGSRITVQRTITPAASTFAIKAEDGTVVSSKRSTLTEILDAMNIMVDNPVCVLTQEDAKLFLKGNEKRKFDFFMKATELERVSAMIYELTQTAGEAEANLARACEDIPEKERLLKEAEEKRDRARVFMETDRWVAQEMLKSHWARYYLEQATLEEQRKQVEKERKIFKKLVARRDRVNAQIEAKNAEIEDTQRSIGAATTETDGLREAVRTLEERYAAAVLPARLAESSLSALRRDEAELRRDLERAEKALSEKRREAARASKGDGGAAAERIRSAEASLSENERLERACQERRRGLQGAADEAQRALKGLVRQDLDLRKQTDAEKRELRALRSGESSSIRSRFGPAAERLDALVRRQRPGAFRGRVAGPIGAHVRVREGMEAWGGAVESAIAPLLMNYVITDARDRALMMRLAAQAGCAPGWKVHTVSAPARFSARAADRAALPPAAAAAPSVESAMRVEEDLVYNVLLEYQQVEKTLLFESEAAVDGSGILDGANRLPRGVARIRLADSTTLDFRNGSRLRTPPTQRPRGVLVADTSARARTLQQNVDALGQQREELERQISAARAAEAEAAAALEGAAEEERGLRERRAELLAQRQEAAELQRELESAAAVDSIAEENEVGECRGRLEATRKDMALKEEQRAEVLSAARPLEEEVRAAQERLGSRSGEMRGISERVNALMQEVHDLVKQQASMEALFPARKRKLEDLEAEHARELETSDRAREELERSSAELFPEGLPSIRYKEERYRKKAQRLLKDKDRILREQGQDIANFDELQERVNRQLEIVHEAKDRVAKYEVALQSTQEDLRRRRAKWKGLRSRMEKVTNASFDRILNKKGHSGGIKLDNKARELKIVVQKDNSDRASKVSDVRQLSGGERSYSTLALLVGLGDVVECPFRLMDEFDVFMDAVSRKKSLEALLEMARIYPHRQFIFLTPNNLNMIRQTPTCKVWVIHKSDNAQGTLDDSWAAAQA